MSDSAAFESGLELQATATTTPKRHGKAHMRSDLTDCRQRAFGLLVLLMGLFPAAAAGADDDNSVQLTGVPGHVLLIRHAEAPGDGGPGGFSSRRVLDPT